MPARRAKFRIIDSHHHRLKFQPRFGHLRGDGSFPDQRIQLGLTAGQPEFVGGFHFGTGGANRFVGLLRVLLFAGELPHLRAEVFVTKTIDDTPPRRFDRLAREIDAIGTHVSDVTVFVQPLCRPHRVTGSQPQLAVSLLLQRTGGERRIRLTDLVAFFD